MLIPNNTLKFSNHLMLGQKTRNKNDVRRMKTAKHTEDVEFKVSSLDLEINFTTCTSKGATARIIKLERSDTTETSRKMHHNLRVSLKESSDYTVSYTTHRNKICLEYP